MNVWCLGDLSVTGYVYIYIYKTELRRALEGEEEERA